MAKANNRFIQSSESIEDPANDPIKKIRQLELDSARLKGQLDRERQLRSLVEKELHTTATRLDALIETQDKVTQQRLDKVAKSSKSDATALICCNDWHTEERIDSDTIDFANEFNLDIAAARISRTWAKSLELLEMARGYANVDEIVLWLGGDLINGRIHEEAREGNFLGQTEAVLYVQDRIAEGIDYLLTNAKVSNIVVVTSFGNHGRSTDKRHVSDGWKTSWEWLAYHNIANYFRNKRKVSFKISRGYHNWVEVQGKILRFHHGDAIRYGGGVGGVHIPARKKIAQWNKRRTPYMDIFGHFHQLTDDCYYHIGGSLCGYNAYALDIGAEPQEPLQSFLVFNRKYGKIMSLPIFCESNVTLCKTS